MTASLNTAYEESGTKQADEFKAFLQLNTLNSVYNFEFRNEKKDNRNQFYFEIRNLSQELSSEIDFLK